MTAPGLCPGPVVLVVPPGTAWERTGSNEGKIHRKKKFQKSNKGLLSSQSVFVYVSLRAIHDFTLELGQQEEITPEFLALTGAGKCHI